MTDKLRVIVVDDEPLARAGLSAILEREPDVTVVRQCRDGYDAVNAIAALDPDIVFLDIQMPEMSGFEVIEAVGPAEMPPVVFVTAFDEFALQAFDAAAVDYVLKPVDTERALQALQRARRRVASEGRRPTQHVLEQVLERVKPARRFLRKFAVREGDAIGFLDAADVDWLESSGNYILLHVGKETYRMRGTMASLESKLDPAQFLRIHRSRFVRVDAIRALQPLYQGDYLLVLHDGTRLTSGRAYKEGLKALLEGI